jgi:hypothetical protein
MNKRIEGMPGYRDKDSGALIFTDEVEYNRVLRRKKIAQSQEDTINIMRDEINELKALVTQITSN